MKKVNKKQKNEDTIIKVSQTMLIRVITYQWTKRIYLKRLKAPYTDSFKICLGYPAILASKAIQFNLSFNILSQVRKYLGFVERYFKTSTGSLFDTLNFIFLRGSLFKLNRRKLNISNYIENNLAISAGDSHPNPDFYNRYTTFYNNKYITEGPSAINTFMKHILPRDKVINFYKNYDSQSPVHRQSKNQYPVNNITKMSHVSLQSGPPLSDINDNCYNIDNITQHNTRIFHRPIISLKEERLSSPRNGIPMAQNNNTVIPEQRLSLIEKISSRLTQNTYIPLHTKDTKPSAYRITEKGREINTNGNTVVIWNTPWENKTRTSPYMSFKKEKSNINENKDSVYRAQSGQDPIQMKYIVKKQVMVEENINRKEIEETVFKMVTKNLNKDIEKGINKQLITNSYFTHKLTEHVYADLSNKIVLEKERCKGF